MRRSDGQTMISSGHADDLLHDWTNESIVKRYTSVAIQQWDTWLLGHYRTCDHSETYSSTVIFLYS